VTPVSRLHIDTVRPSPALARVVVIGQVDLATASQLRDRLFVVLQDQEPAEVDVDLAGVSFLDCAGIGALIAVRNMAVHAGQRVQVSHPTPIIRWMLERTGLLGVLTAPIAPPGQPPRNPASTEPAVAASTRPPV
jgi:anti-anti-sigma factor